jgi:ATP-dependent DNA helicase RecQ
MDPYEKSKKGTKKYKKCKQILSETFGYDEFKPYQYQIIDTILDKQDVCAILPTGYGKSICFQLPTLYSKSPAIVISPLLSLMNDQQMIMKKLGIRACCYNSNVSDKVKLRKEIYNADYDIIYITPESVINNGSFLEKIEQVCGISLFAIDEAHCISSHGHDFRTAYRELNMLRESCPDVPMLCVTATATVEVTADIIKVMSMSGITVKTSFDRANLKFVAEQRAKDSIKNIAMEVKKNKCSSIVYCLTRKETESLASHLKLRGVKCMPYHAGMNKKKREDVHVKFIDDEIKCVVATLAFGMGINKGDVGLVVHYGCPNSIESYYQECGRAGRDGSPSNCHLYYTTKDFIIQKRFINDITDNKYKKVRENLLDTMIDFSNTTTCRRKIILEYFGEKNVDSNCKNCDNCTKIKKKSKMTKSMEIDLYKLLRTVKYVDCNVGTTKIIGILKGSQGKDIIKYMKYKLYGAGKTCTIEYWKKVMNKANELGYIEQYAVSKLYFVPRITTNGKTWLKKYMDENINDKNKTYTKKPLKVKTPLD